MEILDVVDETGAPTGETVERAEAHREGVRHRTAHVWIARNRNGRIQLLLQKRCMQKDSFPAAMIFPVPDIYRQGGVYSFSNSGVERRIKCDSAESDLIYCGQVHKDVDSEFHRQPFHDHQISNVYLLWLDREAEEFELQTEEIESVRWMDYAQVRGMVASDTLPNCIIMEELDLIERHFL